MKIQCRRGSPVQCLERLGVIRARLAMARHIQGFEQKPWPQGFLEFQHAEKRAAPPSGGTWIHEVKFDGYRLQAHVRRGRVTIYTRNGHDWTDRMPTLAGTLATLSDCVLDGELVVLGPDNYSTFSGLRASLTPRRERDLVLMAFDVLWQGDVDLRPYALKARKVVLHDLLSAFDRTKKSNLRLVKAVPGEGPNLLNAACQLTWEGIVSKRLDAPYRAGRGDTWIKSKCRPSETVVIGGWKANGPKFEYLLAGVREPDGSLRYAGSIEGGFAKAGDLVKRLRNIEAESSPFQLDGPDNSRDIHWVRPELLAEVEMAEFTASGKMRQASFKGLREDLA